MNKTIFKILPLAAVLLATSCSKDDGNVATDVVNKEPENTTPVKSATFTVSVNYAPKSLSKTTIDGDGTYAETIKEIFEVGDVLRLMNGSQVVAASNALTTGDIKADNSKAEFTFANVAATNYTANTALTVVLTKASTGINPCASEVKVGTTLSAAVQNYGYWTDDKKVTLELFESKKIEEEEAVPVSYKVPDGTTFTLSQQNAFVVIPTNGVCKIGGTQYEEAGVYAIPATTNVKPLFKKEVAAEFGNVYYVSAVVVTYVNADIFSDINIEPEDGYSWDKSDNSEIAKIVEVIEADKTVKKVAIQSIEECVVYLRAVKGTEPKEYTYYKLQVNESTWWDESIPSINVKEEETMVTEYDWVSGTELCSSDESVATASYNDEGKIVITGKSKGTAYIMAINLYSSTTEYYKVTVE